MRSALLSAVSHDLRRPLAAAVASLGGLRAAGDQLSDDDRRELLETADESLATLSVLVTDLLDVSRVQAGVLAVSLTPTDAAGVVLMALDELDLGPDDVELALDPDLPMLNADPVLLQRVLVNVLTNAQRYTPDGERVRIATSRLGGTAEIRVIDHGPGIAAERREDMFSPFQRLGDTDNTAGLGLGLALSRGFAEGMGGTLTPEDTPAAGSPWSWRFPSRARMPWHPESPGGRREGTHRRRRPAARPRSADHARRPRLRRGGRGRRRRSDHARRPSAPRHRAVGSRDAAPRRRASDPRVLRGWTTAPIIVVSGRTGSADKVEALDAGADDFVTKPFQIDELLARLRVHARRSVPSAGDAVVRFGEIEVDLSAKAVLRAGTRVHLTRPSGGCSSSSPATPARSSRARRC